VAELMLKRKLSETSKNVLKAKASAIAALAGRTSGFRWMAQPMLQEFCEEREFRMFVINGTCKWVVATRFVNDETGVALEKSACAPGRKTWDSGGGKEAAVVAEQVVEVVSQESNGLCEEILACGFIHFESYNAPDMLDQLVAGVTSWLEGCQFG
jgi:hypothetical protein